MARCLEALGHEVIVADPNFALVLPALPHQAAVDRDLAVYEAFVGR